MEKPLKFLVIEDCPEAAKFLRAIFRNTEIHLLHAADLSDAVGLAKDEHPDLILMDVFLPDGNGLDGVQALRSDPVTADIPIIAMSGMDAMELGQRARSVGCSGFISKPLEIYELAFLVARSLAQPVTTTVAR